MSDEAPHGPRDRLPEKKIRWLPRIFNTFYPVLVAIILLSIASFYIDLPIARELNEYIEPLFSELRRLMRSLLEFF